MRRREEAASLGCSAITLIGATTRRSGAPTQWRVPGDLHSNTPTTILRGACPGGTVCDQGPPVQRPTVPDQPSARVPVRLLCVAQGGVVNTGGGS